MKSERLRPIEINEISKPSLMKSSRLQLEEIILGMCLTEGDKYPQVADILSEKNFSKPDLSAGLLEDHQGIFRAFQTLYPSQPINTITVQKITRNASYLMYLSSQVGSAANIRYYAFVLVQICIRESFIDLLTRLSEGRTDLHGLAINEIRDECLDDSNDIFTLIQTATTYLAQIGAEVELDQVKNFSSMIDQKIFHIKQWASIDVLIENLTHLVSVSQQFRSRQAVGHLVHLIKAILSQGQDISTDQLSTILNTRL